MNVRTIGNTPLVLLDNAEYTAQIYAKIEGANPAGSIKDRVALAIIDEAEKSGKLKKDGAVIEATSGNTGIGLAYVCKQRGYRAIIVMPDNMSQERRDLLASYGAKLVLTDGAKGMQGAVEKAQEMHKKMRNSILADQFNNPICAKVHYETTGAEIWEQTQGKVDVFVACVGTGGTLTGVGKFLKEKNPNIRVVAVEPFYSPLLSEGRSGSHAIQGIGANFVPKVLDTSVYDEVVTVTDEEAFMVSRWVRSTERLFVGISSGAALAAVIKLTERAEYQGKNIVTIFPDEGSRYLSEPQFVE